jgi:hypothetical protein
MEVSSQLHAPGRFTRYPLDTMLDEPQNLSERGGEKKIPIISLPRIEPWSSSS